MYLRCLRSGDGTAVWSQAAVDPATGVSYGLHGIAPTVDPLGGLRAGAGADRAVILAFAGRLLAVDLLSGKTLPESKNTPTPWEHHFLGGAMTADGAELAAVSVVPSGGLAGVGSGRLHRFDLRLKKKKFEFAQRWMENLKQPLAEQEAPAVRAAPGGSMYWGTAPPVSRPAGPSP